MLQTMGTDMLSITKIADNIAIIADEFKISKADLFGSYANGTATETSAVDILIEFHPYVTITLLTASWKSRGKFRCIAKRRVNNDVSLYHPGRWDRDYAFSYH